MMQTTVLKPTNTTRLTCPQWLLSAILAGGFILTTPTYADEVTDAIAEATAAYDKGDIAGAAESLNYAVQLLQQMKGEQLSQLLPEPLDGWTAEEAESVAVGAAMFGGGLNAEREYRKGDSRVSIQIVTDSPMLQGVMMMFGNPMFASSSGGKLTKINGQKVIETYDSDAQEGDYKIMVDGRFLITVSGDNVSVDDLKAYVEAIDFERFEE